MTTEENNTHKHTGFMKYIKPIVVTVSTVFITAMITWYVPKFLEKSQVNIHIQELKLTDDRYVYLFDIKNVGRVPVPDLNFSVLTDGTVYSSLFNDSPTTRDPYYRLSKSPFNGEVKINENDEIKTTQYPYSKNKNTSSQEAAAVIKQHVRDIISAKSSVWYNLNITPFYLVTGEEVKASIILKSPIDKGKIKCLPEPTVCSVDKISTISKDKFERIFGALSIQQGSVSNKIFATGIGVSRNMIRGSAIAEAKQRAIHNFYKDIVQKIYGVDVKSIAKTYRTTSNEKEDFNSSTFITLTSKGIIDRAAAIIYHENSEKLESGEIIYEVKGYYELSENIPISQASLKIDSSFILPMTPIELEGEKPDWVDKEDIFNRDIILSSKGVSDANMPYSMAKQLAENRAKSNLAITLNARVKKIIKQYVINMKVNGSEIEEDEIVSSVSKKIANNKLLGSYIIAFYKTPKGLVYALAIMPYNVVKWGVGKKMENHITSPDEKNQAVDSLWKQFMSKKNQDELQAEIQAEINKVEKGEIEKEKGLSD